VLVDVIEWKQLVPEKYFKMVSEILGEKKADIWWTSRIPSFGGLVPKFLVLAGRAEKMYQYIEYAHSSEIEARAMKNDPLGIK